MPLEKPKQLELFPRLKKFRPGRLFYKHHSFNGVQTYKVGNKGVIFAEAHVLQQNGKPLLYDIRIMPGFDLLKRNGIAKRLLNRVIESLKQQGYNDLTLYVDKGEGIFGDNDFRKELYLLRYYSRFGFKVIGKNRGYFKMRLDF